MTYKNMRVDYVQIEYKLIIPGRMRSVKEKILGGNFAGDKPANYSKNSIGSVGLPR